MLVTQPDTFINALPNTSIQLSANHFLVYETLFIKELRPWHSEWLNQCFTLCLACSIFWCYFYILVEKAFKSNWFNVTHKLSISKSDLVELLQVATKKSAVSVSWKAIRTGRWCCNGLTLWPPCSQRLPMLYRRITRRAGEQVTIIL